MGPVLFSWRGRAVHAYPALTYVGLLAGLALGGLVAGRAGLDPSRFVIAATLQAIPATIGARLFFVACNWRRFAAEPARIWRRSNGGTALYGAFLGLLAGSWPLSRLLGLPFLGFWDAGVFVFLPGMAFGRIGCLLNGCCWGRPTGAWYGLRLPDAHGVWRRRIPIQLLEMAWVLLLLAVAWTVQARPHFPGATACLAVAGYALGRLALQTLREDETGGRNPAVMHATSLGIVLAAALAGLLLSRAG